MSERIWQPAVADVQALYQQVTQRLIAHEKTISTMESCTAGLIASFLTDTEGASAILKGAFVTYCNEAKVQQGVPAEVIEAFGVYSEETARAMAIACRKAYGADVGIGVTGTIGRVDPANEDSEPGMVYVAMAMETGTESATLRIAEAEDRYGAKLAIAAWLGEKLLERV